MAYSAVVALIALWLAVKACEAAAVSTATGSGGPPTNMTSTDTPCPPARWYDIFWFYFSNFIIHALSIRSLPGEDGLTSFIFKFSCFLVPFTGARRGLSAILRADILITDHLEAAVESSATCMVVRTRTWKPRNGDKISGCKASTHEGDLPQIEKVKSFRSSTTTSSSDRCDSVASEAESSKTYINVDSLYNARKPKSFGAKLFVFLLVSWRSRERPIEGGIIRNPRAEVQGSYWLPEGYALALLPSDVRIWPQTAGRSHENVRAAKTRLPSNYNMPRVLFAITQTILGVWTVYNARGSQLNKYGYAAYGFSVVPYAAMSIINLIGGLLSREYEDIFLVHSEVMDEMISRGGVADGCVGTVCPPKDRADFALKENEFQFEEEKKHGDLCLQFGEGEANEETATICHEIGPGSTAGREYDINYSEEKPKRPVLVMWAQPWHDYPFTDKEPASVCSKPPFLCPKGSTVLTVPSHTPLIRRKPRSESRFLQLFTLILLCALIIAPYVIIYALCGFRAEQSTGNQRSFFMTWLVWGLLNGFLASEMEQLSIREFKYMLIVTIFVTYGSNTVGGLVMVAQEMLDIGTCNSITF